MSVTSRIELSRLRIAAFHVLASFALCLLEACAPHARHLSEGCYSDFRCLARAATANINEVKSSDLVRYSGFLTRMGRFDIAFAISHKFDRSNMLGQINWQGVSNDIAIREVADQAKDNPNEIASFTPIDARVGAETENSFDVASLYFVLADDIIHRSPSSDGMDVGLSKIFSPEITRTAPNATLTYILTTRWPQMIDRLPRDKQGWHWNELAQTWLGLGNNDQAEKAVSRAEETGLINFKGEQLVFDNTWRTWLSLGNYDRAWAAISRASSTRGSIHFRLDFSRALLKVGRIDRALAIIAATLSEVRHESSASAEMAFFHDIVDLKLAAGDVGGARSVAEEMAILAHRPSFFPSDQLATAAAAFNDCSDRAGAAKLLREASASLPGYHQHLGWGLSLGPITGSTLGLADSLKSEVAVQYYRGGDFRRFSDLLDGMPPAWRTKTWSEVCAAPEFSGWKDPSAEDCIKGGGNELLIDAATKAATQDHFHEADGYLTRAITGFGSENSLDAIRALFNVARIATVTANKSLLASALTAAAIVADRLYDSSEREVEFAEIAALRKELIV
jgi:tetratricopeptide (TPR) repeat protein